ncbi:MAG: outer membrane beta-barrel protein [Desulfobacterales bacterium]
MKRAIMVCMALLLLLPITSYAASIGGAETAGQGKFRTTVDVEFGFDRDLDLDSATEKAYENGNLKWKDDIEDYQDFDDAEISELNRVMVKISYGIIDYLDVYARIGYAWYDSEADFSNLVQPAEFTVMNGGAAETTFGADGDSPVWGIGLKGAYEFGNNWLVGADLQYLSQRGENTFKRSYDDYIESCTLETTIDEWHIAPYAGRKMGNFTAYAGVKYSDIDVENEISFKEKYPGGSYKEKETIELEADDNVGVFLGLDYKLANRFAFNIEGRFIDESAMSLGAAYLF